ncbi:MAG: ProQ/FINO family protein [Albidovulum sp.]
MSQTDKRAVSAVHALLMERFPKAFPKDYDAIRPLKTGIHADLIKLLPDVDHALLRRALANHTQRDGYLLALVHGRGDRRYDLDGRPAGDVTPEEREEALKRLAASTRRGQDKAARVREHEEREAKRKQQREIERKNREAKAARRAEHARVQQEIAARKAALIAQGITPESRSERKRRLAREAAERAARKARGPGPAQGPGPAPDRPAGQAMPRPEPPRPPWDPPMPAERPARAPDRVEPEPARPAPQVEFRKKRRFVPPPDER